METTHPSFPTLSSVQTEHSKPKSAMSVNACLQQLTPGLPVTRAKFAELQGKELAKESILECLVSVVRYVHNPREFGFAVQIIQQWVFVNIGIAEEAGFNAHSQHV